MTTRSERHLSDRETAPDAAGHTPTRRDGSRAGISLQGRRQPGARPASLERRGAAQVRTAPDRLATLPPPIRVMVVDDHEMFAQALAGVLGRQADVEVVATAITIVGARRVLEAIDVDVILLDQRLPDGRGTHCVAELQALRPGARIVLLAPDPEPRLMGEALAAGCTAFLTRRQGVADLVDTIRAAARGAPTPLSPRSALTGSAADADQLTRRETAVLFLLADGLGNAAISERLLISEHTLRNHVQSIMGKLGVHTRLEAVSTALRHGVVSVSDREP